ncbi:MAG: hypothetical protein HY690_14055 [Chloroflexi bacterium]|nr:hypothetical protein [Chloroflexota bacterium]
MARELKVIDVSRVPELLRLAEEVRGTNEPRLLRRDGEDLAILMPARRSPKRPRRAKTRADHEAFLSSLGGWEGVVDTDRLIADIYESRRRSTRPPVEL